MSKYLNVQCLYLLQLLPIAIVVALSIIYFILLVRHLRNQYKIRIGIRQARQAERERKAGKFGEAARPISRKKIAVEMIKGFWNWIWPRLVMLFLVLGMVGLATYYLDKDTFGWWVPSNMDFLPSWWMPVSWSLTDGSIAIILARFVLECLRDNRANDEHGTAKMLVRMGRLTGIGLVIFGAVSHSRSLLWVGISGGLAILGSAQWLRTSYRS